MGKQLTHDLSAGAKMSRGYISINHSCFNLSLQTILRGSHLAKRSSRNSNSGSLTMAMLSMYSGSTRSTPRWPSANNSQKPLSQMRLVLLLWQIVKSTARARETTLGAHPQATATLTSCSRWTRAWWCSALSLQPFQLPRFMNHIETISYSFRWLWNGSTMSSSMVLKSAEYCPKQNFKGKTATFGSESGQTST